MELFKHPGGVYQSTPTGVSQESIPKRMDGGMRPFIHPYINTFYLRKLGHPKKNVDRQVTTVSLRRMSVEKKFHTNFVKWNGKF